MTYGFALSILQLLMCKFKYLIERVDLTFDVSKRDFKWVYTITDREGKIVFAQIYTQQFK